MEQQQTAVAPPPPAQSPQPSRRAKWIFLGFIVLVAAIAIANLVPWFYKHYGNSEAKEVVRMMINDISHGKPVRGANFEGIDRWGAAESIKFSGVEEKTTYAGKSYEVHGEAEFSKNGRTEYFTFTVAKDSVGWELVDGNFSVVRPYGW